MIKSFSITLLLAALFLPVYSYAVVPPPPEGSDCPCDAVEFADGTTALEILAEVCPGGTLAADGTLILNRDELAVFVDDPRREFRVEIEDGDNLFCAVTQAPVTLGSVGLSTEQLQACRETVVFACGLQTRPIPTVSQWGLIAMAGVLGLIGLAAIRRKRAAV